MHRILGRNAAESVAAFLNEYIDRLGADIPEGTRQAMDTMQFDDSIKWSYRVDTGIITYAEFERTISVPGSGEVFDLWTWKLID